MKALWLDHGKLSQRKLLSPHPDANEVLLEVERAGVCGTDLELLQGYAAFTGVPGHEFCARVIEGPPELLGRRVTANINIGCGECARCRQGLAKHCSNRSVVGIRDHQGAFAEKLVVPAPNCLILPEELPVEYCTLAEPLAAALEIPDSVEIGEADRILIVGAGRLAVLIALVLQTESSTVEVLARNPQRRERLAHLGIDCVGVPDGQYDIVVEVTGSPEGFSMALEATRPRGTLVMKSTYAEHLNLDASRVVVDEVRLVGSRCGPMEKAVAWLAEGRLALSPLTFETFPLSGFEEAFSAARSADVYKVLFDPRA